MCTGHPGGSIRTGQHCPFATRQSGPSFPTIPVAPTQTAWPHWFSFRRGYIGFLYTLRLWLLSLWISRTYCCLGRTAITLDGLNECGDQGALETLMKLVLMPLQALPLTFAVLISSRPEQEVVSAWDDAMDRGLDIPCEDIDKVGEETLHTVRHMVEVAFVTV
ncbi:uncharacterized protein EI90DRAFT_3076142 [Cantharellus anzutake]|uniref:uncharacterized protein n=1 Tax=Cantharellus anzutake TaxID=1750568 RepID=UPI0019069ED4|nr:uncharacterized protein EI90DRAFT_3076142 [Cantharellus anzutake]KAF8324174.1 hypothetical protein EI90DRAFT_3076142 [Cantharellus anzutake]